MLFACVSQAAGFDRNKIHAISGTGRKGMLAVSMGPEIILMTGYTEGVAIGIL
jgi:hypothetical protein